jgi:hypothetical protein
LGEIQAGKRHRANPVHGNGAHANPDSDDEEHGEAGGGVDLTTWAVLVEWKEGDDDPDDELSVGCKYGIEVVDLVGRGLVRVSGAEAILKITAARLNDHLSDDVDVPSSWYK